jgi:hypothetical protein
VFKYIRIPAITVQDIPGLFEHDDTPFVLPNGHSGWPLQPGGIFPENKLFMDPMVEAEGYWDVKGRKDAKNRMHLQMLTARKTAQLAENEALMNMELRADIGSILRTEKEVTQASQLNVPERAAAQAEALELLLEEERNKDAATQAKQKKLKEDKMAIVKEQRKAHRRERAAGIEAAQRARQVVAGRKEKTKR